MFAMLLLIASDIIIIMPLLARRPTARTLFVTRDVMLRDMSCSPLFHFYRVYAFMLYHCFRCLMGTPFSRHARHAMRVCHFHAMPIDGYFDALNTRHVTVRHTARTAADALILRLPLR